MSTYLRVCAAAVAAAILLGGCSQPALSDDVADELQVDVQQLAVQAARGDTADASAAARTLADRVRIAEANGKISEERAALILQRIDGLIAVLADSGAAPAPVGTPGPVAQPAQPLEPEPSAPPAPAGTVTPEPVPTPDSPAPAPTPDPPAPAVPDGATVDNGGDGGVDQDGSDTALPDAEIEPAVDPDGEDRVDVEEDNDDDGGKGRGRGRGRGGDG
ncbi:hypothetical protein GCM10027403_24390 [Arthrobacter tecti]